MSLKKFKLFFFFFFILIIPILFSCHVNALVSGDNLTIKPNWLYVQTGNYEDINPQPWKNNIRFNTGGKDLLSFENLGLSVEGDNLLYRSTVRFGFEINAYTDVDYRDIYPNIADGIYEAPFFTVDNRGWFWLRVSLISYAVQYNTLNFGSLFRDHEYTGTLPITIGIQDIVPPSGEISVNGITFQVPTYTYDIVEVTVADVRSGEVGAYEDIFTNIGEIQEGTVSTQILREDDFSSEEAEVIETIGDYALGWTAGQIERDSNIQYWKEDTAPEGTSYSTITFDENQPYVLPMPITLQPEVYCYSQINEVRSAYIVYDTVLAEVTEVNGPVTSILPKRIVAVHTGNRFLHVEYYVDVNFFATVPASAEVIETVLNDPYLQRGDFIWDTSFTGAYDVTWTPTQADWLSGAADYLKNLFFGSFGWIIWLILLFVGLYVFIKVGVPYLSRRVKKKY